MSRTQSFDEFFGRATGGMKPYDYQRRIALGGLPDLLNVPTGTGKTAAIVLGWLYRRRFHSEASIRESTPRWLVYVLPMRVLVEQVVAVTGRWLDCLGIPDKVKVYEVRGGQGRVKSEWRTRPEDDAIFVGTLDMVTSRQLNRGYGARPKAWPIDFGLFNNGCHFVYDEVQLMGPALPTSRQLHGLRAELGVAMPSTATWMSATVDPKAMQTIDAPSFTHETTLDDQDRQGHLSVRLSARRRVEELKIPPDKPAEVARALANRHRPATLSLAIFNTVARGGAVFKELGKLKVGAELVLLHSRFRPADREKAIQRALAPIDATGPGRIVVSTQVIEAGVDISAALLLTEAAPWPSIVQRAGRCNRDGMLQEAAIAWLKPPHSAPYEPADVDEAAKELQNLEGRQVTSIELGERTVSTASVVHPILRRVDLIGLFDTLPDLSGNDIDVSRFIRDANDLDVEVAWAELAATAPVEIDTPSAAERCPVPVGEFRTFLAQGHDAWRFDHLTETWVKCSARDIRPGMVIVMPAKAGGYTSWAGWDSQSKTAVLPAADLDPIDALEGLSEDRLSIEAGRWITLEQHLADVEREVRSLSKSLGLGSPNGLSSEQLHAAAMAGRFHDIGKAHPSFQSMLLATEPESRTRLEGQVWAKSAIGYGPRNERRHYSHELVSALTLLDSGEAVLEGVVEKDLVRYLVAAHHGHVRLGFRPIPDERPLSDGTVVALGVHDGERIGPIPFPGGQVPRSAMHLSVMGVGRTDNRPSWAARTLALRDRQDLGPFRLAFLEALVRLADWRASASYREEAHA